MSTESSFSIDSGRVEVLWVYNVASIVDLGAAKKLVKSAYAPEQVQADTMYLGYDPQPIRLIDTSEPFTVGKLKTSRLVETTVWETGLVTIKYTIDMPPESQLEVWCELSAQLGTLPQLSIDSRHRAEEVVVKLGAAMKEAHVEVLREDYIVFVLDKVSGETADSLRKNRRREIATLLRPEDPTNPLSEDGIDAALAFTFAPRERTLVVVDGNAALVFGENTNNKRELLEFVQMQLLELRHLQDQLSRELDEAHALFARLQHERNRLAKSRWRWLLILGRALRASLQQIGVLRHAEGSLDEGLFRLGMLIVDAEECIDNVTHAVDLIGDQELVDLHEVAKERFDLYKLAKTVREQLASINDIHQKLTDRHHSGQGLFWELVVVILIAIEVVNAFLNH